MNASTTNPDKGVEESSPRRRKGSEELRDRLIEAIRGTAAGRTHVDPGIAGRLFDHVSAGTRMEPDSTILEGLSDREVEVLESLGLGLSNSEIAAKLFLSEGTVRNYVSSLISKLGVTDRTQAAVLAVRHGVSTQP